MQFTGATEIEQCECTFVHEEIVRDVAAHMPPDEKICDLADFFKVFADSTRIRILYVLLHSELCVCDLAEALHMTQSAISHQLRMLKQMALVKNKRDGKTIYYSLSDSHIAAILSQGLEHIEE